MPEMEQVTRGDEPWGRKFDRRLQADEASKPRAHARRAPILRNDKTRRVARLRRSSSTHGWSEGDEKRLAHPSTRSCPGLGPIDRLPKTAGFIHVVGEKRATLGDESDLGRG